MDVAALLYVLAAVALFLIAPLFMLAGAWRRLEPGARKALVGLYLFVVGAAVGLYWLVERWASTSPLD